MSKDTPGIAASADGRAVLSSHEAKSQPRTIEEFRAENERLVRLADIALDLVERACREGEPQATVMRVQLRLRLGFSAALTALRELDRQGRLEGLVKSPHLQGLDQADAIANGGPPQEI